MSRKTLAVLCSITFLLSTLFFGQRIGKEPSFSLTLGGEQLGKLCVSQAYPTITKGITKEKKANGASEKILQEKKMEKKPKKKANNDKPDVIIYHTHSSESYQPYTASNFHTEKVEGSVREVGNVLTKELQSLGIGVVHDKTVHDRPSYNESYDRSLETVVSLREKYPSAKYIIDLHRDAAAYAGNKGKTVTIKGDTVATYGLVVGRNNANYHKLMEFAKKVNQKADSMYPGFGGRIIEKTYRYNEYIADNYLLLEVGNNQNQIEQVKATGKYFAHVLAQIIEEQRE